jgi:hypothetical protein
MREWIAADACGNSTSAVQYVTLYDNEAPIFTSLPEADVVLEASPDCNTDTSPEVTGMPESADNCSASEELELTYTDSEAVETCAGSYTFTRTWTVTDYCGNQTEFVQSISVEDTTGPVFTDAPSDQINQCAES